MITHFEEANSLGYINQSCAYNPELENYSNIDRLMYIIFCIIQCGFMFFTIGAKFDKLYLVFTFTIYVTNTVNLAQELVNPYMSAENKDQAHFQSCLLPDVNITECPMNTFYDFFKKFSEISKIELSFLCMILMFEFASVDGKNTEGGG